MASEQAFQIDGFQIDAFQQLVVAPPELPHQYTSDERPGDLAHAGGNIQAAHRNW